MYYDAMYHDAMYYDDMYYDAMYYDDMYYDDMYYDAMMLVIVCLWTSIWKCMLTLLLVFFLLTFTRVNLTLAATSHFFE